MNELFAKVRRRLMLWRERCRYELARPLSTDELMSRHASGIIWNGDRSLLARHITAMPDAPARTKPVASDRIRLLGRDIAFAGDWHVDPFFGVRWPEIFVGAISDFRPGSDVVLVWELNRMLFMLDRAEMFRETGDHAHAAACFELMRSWSEQNRFMVGKNWRSPMEAGMRLVVWSQTLSVLAAAELPADGDSGLIMRSVLRQIEFLADNFSRAVPPNNHLIGEAATLFTAATYWPNLRLASEWCERAESVLEQEAERQILSDGVEYEVALNYHLFVLDFYLLYLYAKKQKDELPREGLMESVERMIVAVLRFASPNGRIPRIGDDSVDEFFVLKPLDEMEHQTPSDSLRFESFVKSSYAVVLRETNWGSALLDLSEPVLCSARYEESGLISIRRPDCHLVVTAGPQSDREFAQGHLHSDCASFELSMGRETIVVDKGTYLYTYDRVLRDHFRSAAAHNTVLIDDSEPMQSRDTFAWRNIYSGRLGDVFDDGVIAHTSILRELTNRDGESLQHVRIFAVLNHAVFIVDNIRPANSRSASRAQWRFHLPFAGDRVTRKEGAIVIGDVDSPRFFMEVHGAGSQPEVVHGPGVVDAMFSRRYGEVADGALVRFSRAVDAGVTAVTVFHDGSRDVGVENLSRTEVLLRPDTKGALRVACTFAPIGIAISGNNR